LSRPEGRFTELADRSHVPAIGSVASEASVLADQAGPPGTRVVPRADARISESGRDRRVPGPGLPRSSFSIGVATLDPRKDGRQPFVHGRLGTLPPRPESDRTVERGLDARTGLDGDRA